MFMLEKQNAWAIRSDLGRNTSRLQRRRWHAKMIRVVHVSMIQIARVSPSICMQDISCLEMLLVHGVKVAIFEK